MSVLVWDGISLAADRALNDGHVVVVSDKIWEYKQSIIAGVGIINDIMMMKSWVMDGCNKHQFPKVTATSCFVVVKPGTGLIRYTVSPFAIAHGFNKCAFGTGRDFAYGALACGATAEEAVRAASIYDLHSGKGATSFRLGRILQ